MNAGLPPLGWPGIVRLGLVQAMLGAVFGFTRGAPTQRSGVQHGGTLTGMLLAALAGRRVAGARLGSLRAWTVGGLFGAAASDVARWFIGDPGSGYAAVFLLEAGMFAVAAGLAAKVSGPQTGAAATTPASTEAPPAPVFHKAPLALAVGAADAQALRAGGS